MKHPKSVFVARLYQARCDLCNWSGEILDNFKGAEIDKLAHIDEKHWNGDGS